MDLTKKKIEICLLSDEMDLVKPTWSVCDTESGESLPSITDELAFQCMNTMMYCAMQIKSYLDYKQSIYKQLK